LEGRSRQRSDPCSPPIHVARQRGAGHEHREAVAREGASPAGTDLENPNIGRGPVKRKNDARAYRGPCNRAVDPGRERRAGGRHDAIACRVQAIERAICAVEVSYNRTGDRRVDCPRNRAPAVTDRVEGGANVSIDGGPDPLLVQVTVPAVGTEFVPRTV
jgi:hypothetical protein